MLSMTVQIFQRNGLWVLDVNCPNAQGGKVYHFTKGEFSTAQDAKQFLYDNIGLFVVHMGNV